MVGYTLPRLPCNSLTKIDVNLVTSFQSGIKNKCEGANANFGHLKFNEVQVIHKS